MEVEDNVLISLEPRHAENILAGLKRVELRRRTMNIKPGSTVWIYAKLPVGSIIGRATLARVHVRSPSKLWREFGAISGVSRSEFFEYFSEASKGVALELENSQRLTKSFDLRSLRQVSREFQPPQFFSRLRNGPLLTAISDCS
jgi:predicted transcriptional regulator